MPKAKGLNCSICNENSYSGRTKQAKGPHAARGQPV